MHLVYESKKIDKQEVCIAQINLFIDFINENRILIDKNKLEIYLVLSTEFIVL